RSVQHGDPSACQTVCVTRITFSQPLAANQEQNADGHSDQHSCGRADPLTVDRVLQKKRYAEKDSENADSVEPASTDARFEITFALRFDWSLGRHIVSRPGFG